MKIKEKRPILDDRSFFLTIPNIYDKTGTTFFY